MTKEIKIGKVNIGAGNRVAIQSMTNVSMLNVDKSVQQILSLQSAGCDIVRVAVTDKICAENIAVVKSQVAVPIVADIHFDYQLALAALGSGADKIRINPGNLKKESLREIIACAKEYNVPIRIGVNSGSVSFDALSRCKGDKISALCESLKEYVTEIEGLGFDKLVLSAKCTSVKDTVALARVLHKSLDYPLHLGVTEAGLLLQGTVKNSVALGSLLMDGIGDTIRVSLTDAPEKEVEIAKMILSALDLRDGVDFVSCPKCGRCSQDLEFYAKSVYDYCVQKRIKLKVAVMGCEVNGPGECADADIGMACGKGKNAFFKKGKVFRVVEEENALKEFLAEIDRYDAD